MRVVEPQQFKQLPRKKKSKKLLLFVMLCAALVCLGGYLLLRPKPKSSSAPTRIVETSSVPNSVAQTANNKPLKTFTGEEFKELYRSMVYPNTQQFTELPPITGNIEADNRIRALAEGRGYKLTSIPVGPIVKINEPRLNGDDLLQPLAAESWQAIKAAAQKDAIHLTLISAYRSPEYQRELFTSRLYAHGVTAAQVAAAQADVSLNQTLDLTAVPGFSRHHTGYTVDMWCDDGSSTFLSSSCYRWIHANNYEHAKEYGWIPSYPDGANEQGPEPEPWEYVWVGRNRLTE